MHEADEDLAALDSRIALAASNMTRQCWTTLEYAVAGDVNAADRAETVMMALGNTLQLMRHPGSNTWRSAE